MATYLITGASRGIGLELTRQLLKLPTSQVSKIFAVARKTDSGPLQDIVHKDPRVIPISASVNDAASVQKAAETIKANLQGKGLDVLVNNAGIIDSSADGIKSMDPDSLTQVLDVNVVGVQRVTSAFLPLLEIGTQKKIINISSGVGSFANAEHTAALSTDAYIISKAALNMLTVRWAHQYSKKGYTIVAISPGWLKTDMGAVAGDADLSAEVGVAEVKRLILESGNEQNGQFLNINVPKTGQMVYEYDGKDIPW